MALCLANVVGGGLVYAFKGGKGRKWVGRGRKGWR